MSSVPTLLKKLETLHRQKIETETQIAQVERDIVSAGPKPRKKRSTSAEVAELAKSMVKVLVDAGEPLPRREIANRLGLTPTAVSYRLQKAIAAKFVEPAGHGHYRASTLVPSF